MNYTRKIFYKIFYTDHPFNIFNLSFYDDLNFYFIWTWLFWHQIVKFRTCSSCRPQNNSLQIRWRFSHAIRFKCDAPWLIVQDGRDLFVSHCIVFAAIHVCNNITLTFDHTHAACNNWLVNQHSTDKIFYWLSSCKFVSRCAVLILSV